MTVVNDETAHPQPGGRRRRVGGFLVPRPAQRERASAIAGIGGHSACCLNCTFGIQLTVTRCRGTWIPLWNNYRPRSQYRIVAITAALRIPYTAPATVAYSEDLVRKFQKAKGIRGAKFIHVLSPCPPGWKVLPAYSIRISRLAVESKVFPLYEVEIGEKSTITVWPKREVSVREYLKLQGRFSHLTEEDIEFIQKNVDREWEKLVAKAEAK